MSEAYSVEDGGTPPPDPSPAPAPEPQAAAPEPVAPEAPAEIDVEVEGQKMVPLSALQEAREKLRVASERAGKVDELERYVAESRPYVEFLKNNQELLRPRQAAPEPAPLAPDQDPALVNLARTLDLYTADGKPDAGRAATIRNLVKAEAQSIAQETVRPLNEQNVRGRAEANLRDAMSVTLPDGRKADPAILRQIWANGDAKTLADPQGAAAAVMMAIGMSGFAQPAPAAPGPAAPSQAPVVSEPAGGRNVNRAPVTEFEQRVLKVRGIPEAKYAELSKGFRPGGTNVLED